MLFDLLLFGASLKGRLDFCRTLLAFAPPGTHLLYLVLALDEMVLREVKLTPENRFLLRVEPVVPDVFPKQFARDVDPWSSLSGSGN